MQTFYTFSQQMNDNDSRIDGDVEDKEGELRKSVLTVNISFSDDYTCTNHVTSVTCVISLSF